jgi:hypothetical protein
MITAAVTKGNCVIGNRLHTVTSIGDHTSRAAIRAPNSLPQ